VIARLDRAIAYSKAPVTEAIGLGVLDPAFAGMTTGDDMP
jgi:hypothetical protein